MPQFDLKKATVTFEDSGGGNTLTLKIAEGTLSYDEKKPRKYTKDRGLLSSVMNGDEEPVDVKLDVIWEFITASSGSPTPEDAVKRRGQASAWVSSDSDVCNPYAVDIVIRYLPACSPTQNEKITLTTFRYEAINHDFKNAMLALTGKCNVTQATVTRY